MIIVESFCTLCALLLVGKLLRSCLPVLRKLYLPSAVIGGSVGLAILTCFGPRVPSACTAGWKELPGFLISIVFASLFLGIKRPPMRGLWKLTGTQLCFGQICA